MKVFFDASAIVKRYITEMASEEVDQLCLQASQFSISLTCIPEVISAFSRLKREAKLTLDQYRLCKLNFIKDIFDADVCSLTPRVITQSISVLEKNSLRGMDAMHIACALEWKAELFVSSDQKQLLAAKKSGLKTHALQDKM